MQVMLELDDKLAARAQAAATSAGKNLGTWLVDSLQSVLPEPAVTPPPAALENPPGLPNDHRFFKVLAQLEEERHRRPPLRTLVLD